MNRTENSFGQALRREMSQRDILPFIGIYDVFSATIAARHFNALFVSGFSFAASHYGLPDIGFIAWSDIVAFVQRLRTVVPLAHILVDIDDGYGDAEVACHVVSMLESLGASAVVLEDQQRPRKCGHFGGKQILPLPDYLVKLKRVLAARRDMVVIARTDSSEPDDIVQRLEAFAEAGADAVLADGLRDFGIIKTIRERVKQPVAFNQIAGGKSPACTLKELREVGVSLVIYSTPCLFAAQTAVKNSMEALLAKDGKLQAEAEGAIGVTSCKALLDENLANRDKA